ncbi:hypothetical protein L3X38_036242 [Prunus dulcis]|uniref:Uncharacterized protein n=1 Tax=Prunus dulcis TaxID=3755 RepID=A0AAD4V116_PRUDU|nr:hypothetical protein L3X38_036242 [Prunus dulcis]
MTGTRSSTSQLVELEPEIEQKLQEIRWSQKQDREKKNQQGEDEMALVQNETMGDHDIPNIPTSPSSIVLPAAARNFELKNIHFNMMPSFHGLSFEDPLAKAWIIDKLGGGSKQVLGEILFNSEN